MWGQTANVGSDAWFPLAPGTVGVRPKRGAAPSSITQPLSHQAQSGSIWPYEGAAFPEITISLGHGKAIRYGIGVGRKGFTWSGTECITRKKEWPNWFPSKEMIARQPYQPRFVAGGETNPLGARAMYLGNTEYRTNQPSTIGSFVSSGCIRLTNDDVEDLYSRVSIGTRVVVLPGANTAASQFRH